jgi:CheY-like chemotaxis protein
LRVRRPLVLVVDDIPDNREMYIEYLEYIGYRVAGATDGESAIALARSLRPDVILMDLSLPGTDGWEATRILKADPATASIHIIAVTGHTEQACRTRALAAGFGSFVAKPSTPPDVAQHIARALST